MRLRVLIKDYAMKLAILVLSCIAGVAIGETQDLIDSGIPAWRKHEELLRNGQHEASATWRIESREGLSPGEQSHKQDSSHESEIAWDLDRDRWVSLIRNRDGTIISVRCQNDRYHFRLTRKDSSESYRMVTGDVGIDPQEPLVQSVSNLSAIAFTAFQSNADRLADLVSSDTLDVTYDEMSNKLSVKGAEPGSRSLVFDLDEFWRIKKAEAREILNGQLMVTIQTNYFDDSNTTELATALPTRTVAKRTLYAGEQAVDVLGTEIETYERSNIEPCTKPAEEFFLPYYGIDEDSVGFLNNRAWLRWSVIGISCFVIVLALIALKKNVRHEK